MPACPGTSTGWLFFSHALILNKNPHLWMDTKLIHRAKRCALLLMRYYLHEIKTILFSIIHLEKSQH